MFLEQFTNRMIVVLLTATAITAFIGDFKDTIAILAVVMLNGVVGFLLGLVFLVVGVGLQAGAFYADWPWQTMLFSAFAFLQLGNAIAVRSERGSALRLGVRSNPFLFVAILVAVALQLLIVYLPARRVRDGSSHPGPARRRVRGVDACVHRRRAREMDQASWLEAMNGEDFCQVAGILALAAAAGAAVTKLRRR